MIIIRELELGRKWALGPIFIMKIVHKGKEKVKYARSVC